MAEVEPPRVEADRQDEASAAAPSGRLMAADTVFSPTVSVVLPTVGSAELLADAVPPSGRCSTSSR